MPSARFVAVAVLLVSAVPAYARDLFPNRPNPARDAMMLKFDLTARIEQRCDVRARDEIVRDNVGYRPDKVIAYAFGPSRMSGTEIDAPNAIFRSKGRWFRLSFHCKTTPDGLAIEAFEHIVGGPAPGWSMSQVYSGD